jgi:hypothetical protein
VGIVAPIPGIDPIADGEISHAAGYFERPNLVFRVRFLVDRVWRPKKQRANPQSADQQLLVKVQLEADNAIGKFADIGMGEGVIANLVAFLINAGCD